MSFPLQIDAATPNRFYSPGAFDTPIVDLSALDGPLSVVAIISNTAGDDVTATAHYAFGGNTTLASGGTELFDLDTVDGDQFVLVIPLPPPTARYLRLRVGSPGSGPGSAAITVLVVANATLAEYARRNGDRRLAEGLDTKKPPLL